ncbi:hypothetical protein J1G42_13950 [Cellulomonas sp. zg-ZUI222]|uniref:hypothetical protein n=1 Tax=Cellulomonas TaxID=1707 RepID=UPI001A94018C|nr:MULTISPECIES: hypothetical protein [Cellulomonas]MBO0901480.1 hypothetical protein [Cellulomonas sp. zg-ZUI22]MBO0921926.1 hypothetical protein [Cellulomonas wangleii]
MSNQTDDRPRGATAVVLYVLVPLATAGLLYAAFNGHASDARVLFGSIVGTATCIGVVYKLLTSWGRR